MAPDSLFKQGNVLYALTKPAGLRKAGEGVSLPFPAVYICTKGMFNLQRDLYSAGYTSITNADGYFGTITENAVKAFQKNNGLTADGLAGDKTKQALWNKLH